MVHTPDQQHSHGLGAPQLDEQALMLHTALWHHRHARWQQAARCYCDLLHQVPQHAEALHGLGILASQAGHTASAIQLLRSAIASNSTVPRFHNNLGNLLTAQGDLEAAQHHYREALRLCPTYAEAHHNLGLVLKQLGQRDAAVQHFDLALRHKPTYAQAHYHLGNIRCEQEAWDAAVSHYQQALHYKADYAEAYVNLGRVWQEQGQLDQAATQYRLALQHRPTYAEAHYNLGNVCHAQGALEAAAQHYARALALAPQAVEVQYNLANVLRQQGQLEAALYHFTQLLQRQPGYARGQWGRALVWLGLGRLTPGWAAYEWRWPALQWPRRSFPQPRWQGSSLAGQTLLVHAEQGIGDELLFASCLPDIVAQAVHVVLECDQRLLPLMCRSFPTMTVRPRYQDERHWLPHTRAADVQIPAGSLPGRLRPTLGHFPWRSAYLVADPGRRAMWTERLAYLGPALKVGIAWRSLAKRHSAPYYTRLDQWQPLLTQPGVHWINLQYDEVAQELSTVLQHWGVSIHCWEDLDVFHDLDGVAALMMALDLVIAPDTTVAQLAASLGVPVWRLMVYEASEMDLGTGVSPWSPTLRNYRQPQSGNWAAVLQQAATDLAALVAYRMEAGV